MIHSFSDCLTALLAERDENTCRLNLKPSELVLIGKRIEDVEKESADKRKRAGVKSENSGKTRDKVGAVLGISGKTYEKAKAIVDSGDSELIKQMDRDSVEQAYKALKGDLPEITPQQKFREEMIGIWDSGGTFKETLLYAIRELKHLGYDCSIMERLAGEEGVL